MIFIALIGVICFLLGAGLAMLVARNKHKKYAQMVRQRAEIEYQNALTGHKQRFLASVSSELQEPMSQIITPLQQAGNIQMSPELSRLTQTALVNAQDLLHRVNMLLDFRNTGFVTDKDFKFVLPKPAAPKVVYTPLERIQDEKQGAEKTAASGAQKAEQDVVQGADVQTAQSADAASEPIDEKAQFLQRALDQADNNKSNTQPQMQPQLPEEPEPATVVATVNLNVDDSNAADAANQAWESTSSYTAPESHKFTMLMVDDAPDMCRFARDYFRGEYNVITASDGEQALAKLRENDGVDLVVSDVTMPRMDGLQLCETIKTDLRWSHIPVILLTGRTGEEIEVKGLKLGADDYITKPFNPETLRLRVKKFIEKKENRQKQFKEKIDVAPSEITITSVDEQFIQKAIKIVEEHMSDQEFSVEALGIELDMSRTYLYKKLMNITGKGPAEFIRIIRLKRGKQLLEKSQMQITEIAYTLGYTAPKRFTENFKAEFGMSPSEYKKMMSQNSQ